MRPDAGRSLVPWAVVALMAFAAGLPALVPGFIHDDHRIVEQNELIRDLSRVPEYFSKGYWSVGDASVPSLYRPLTILSFALNYAVGGAHPFGYRLANLLLHVLVTLAVLALARRLLPPAGGPAALDPSLVAALLFALHPIHTEVLGAVVGRAELLAAAGTLGCVLGFLAGGAAAARGRSSAPWYALSIGAFVAGFLAKENAVAAPFLVLASDLLLPRAGRRRPAWGFHLAAAAVMAACLALRVWALGGANPLGFVHRFDNPIAHASFLQGRLTALGVLGRYALLLIWPWRLCNDYSFDAIPLARGILDPAPLLGMAVVLGGGAAFLITRKRAPVAAFALAWVALALAPVANLLFPIGTIMAERLLYLPSAGFCLGAGWAIEQFRLRLAGGAVPGAGRRSVAVGAAVALGLLALGARSELRLRDWMDDYTIFKSAMGAEPRSVRVLFNYGAECEGRGEDREAERAYRAALALAPEFAEASYNLAGVLGRQRRWDEAIELYRTALGAQPGNVRYLVNLAHALNGKGRHAEARDEARRALTLDPQSDQGCTILGAAELGLLDPAGAVRAYAEAVRLQPGNADYLRNLGLAQAQAGDAPAAAASYRRGLALRPDDPDLLSELGLALLKAGDPAGAIEPLQRAVAIGRANPVHHYRLAQALEEAGRRDEAVAEYRESIRLAPGVPIPRRGLGLLLYRMGDRTGAREALESAARLDPDRQVMDARARAVLESLR